MTGAERTAIWSHRGRLSAAPGGPENTLAAFRDASRAGVDGIELDTWLTRDGAFVVHHDRNVAEGRLDELPRAEIPPTVADLLDAVAACDVPTLNVELKVAPDAAPDLAASLGTTLALYLLAEAGEQVAAGRIVVSSFSRLALDAVRDAAGGVGSRGGALRTGYLVDEMPGSDDLEGLVDAGHSAVNVHHRSLDAAGAARCRSAGLGLVAWTADDEDDIRRLYVLVVDVVISNDPVTAMRMRAG